MNDQAAAPSPPAPSPPASSLSVTEPKPAVAEARPGPSRFELELLGMAIDANELISRIHAGQGEDLNSIIRCAIDERPTFEEIASGPTSDLQDAA
ncbi:MAG: hypothetical protein ACI89L_001960 [Phycisphaerales bacterium]|jgi:hypothetical protein